MSILGRERATVLAWRANDWMRSRGAQWLSFALVAAYFVAKHLNRAFALRCLMDAHRFRQSPGLDRLVSREKSTFAETGALRVQKISADREDLALERTIVLKKPIVRDGYVEKGVLLLKFTETFAFFHHAVDCESLLNYFHVVLEPSWSGYCDANILFWMQFRQHRVIVQSTEKRDFEFLVRLNSNLVPVSFGSGDWVDHRVFRPLDGVAKSYDVIYVSNYNPIKRHHILFRAVKQIADSDYRVALAFGKWGSAKAEIQSLIDYYGVRRNVEIHESLPQSQVNELLNMAKVNVLLSLKEGSSRSIFEGFFANVPGIVLQNNIGVNKDYINRLTGRLVDERMLAESLADFRDGWRSYAPREWAMRNISPAVTTAKLEKCLRQIACDTGEPWSTGLVAKVNGPEAEYFAKADKLRMPSGRSVASVFLKSDVMPAGTCNRVQSRLAEICRQI
jgi:glycosyltransferase involved in cell wall biosynthesis